MFCLLGAILGGLLGPGKVSAQTLTIPRFYVAKNDMVEEMHAALPEGFPRGPAYSCNFSSMNNRGDFVATIRANGNVWNFAAWIDGVYYDLNKVFARDLSGLDSYCESFFSSQHLELSPQGEIAGICWAKSPVNQNSIAGGFRLFVFRNGAMADLGAPPAASELWYRLGWNFVLRWNNAGQLLVGDANGNYLYDLKGGKVTTLSPPNGAWVARALNDKGEVAGQLADGTKGVVWSGGTLREVPLPADPNALFVSPSFIDNEGRMFWTSGHITDRDGKTIAVTPLPNQERYGNYAYRFGVRYTAQGILSYFSADGGRYFWRNGETMGVSSSLLQNPEAHYMPSSGQAGYGGLVDIDDSGRALSTSWGIMNPSVPLFIDQPKSIQVRSGQPATLSATVAGTFVTGTDPNTVYSIAGSWRHDGNPAEGATSLDGANWIVLTNKLKIAAVSARHAGNYCFVATNVSGVVTSAVARLEILTPPEVKQGPTDIAACPGYAVQFAVEATGVPTPTFQWLFNGKDLPGETGPTLTLREVGPAAEGVYSVTASNSEGSVPGGSARLSLLAAPEIQSVSPAQTVAADAKAVLAVAATGSAPLAFHWRRNGEPLPEVTGPVLSIEKAGKADAGEYAVTVVNGCGAAESATMILTVLPPPPRLLNPRLLMGFEVAGEVGRTYRIEAKPDAGPQDWTVLARLTLTTSPQFFLDMDSPANPKRIYRAVAEP